MHSAERKTGFAYVLEEVDKWTGHPVWVLKRVNPFCMFIERTFQITLLHSCCLGRRAASTPGNGRILHEVSSMTGLYGLWNGVATSWLGSVGGYPKQRLKRRLVLVRIWFIVTMLWSKFLIECQKLWGSFAPLPSFCHQSEDSRQTLNESESVTTRPWSLVFSLGWSY